MRHAVFGQKLSRDTHARQALLKNLASSLFSHGKVTTTQAKAKFAKPFVEKLITVAKKNKLYSKRSLATVLTKEALFKLIGEINSGFVQRPGGYTRTVKLPPRRGDAAPMARLEILDWGKSPTKAKAKTAPPTKSASKTRAKISSASQIKKATDIKSSIPSEREPWPSGRE